MAQVKRFEDLEVWKIARVLVKDVYSITREKPFALDFGLRDQIQRAAVSTMSNVAEGFERSSNKEFVKFLFITKGSAGEVRSLLYVAVDQGYITEENAQKLQAQCVSISRLSWGLIKHLQKNSDWKTGVIISLLMLGFTLKETFAAF